MAPARRWLAFLSAAIAAVLAVVLPVTIASAAGVSAAGTRVGASNPQMILAVGSSRPVLAGEGRCEGLPQPGFASDACVAAEDAGEASGDAVDVGHAGIHQFPGVTAGKSQFFDGEDLGQLSDTDGVNGVLQQNGNIRYVIRAPQDVGVDRTTGLPTDVYTVIRKPDGSVLTMFPGTSPLT